MSVLSSDEPFAHSYQDAPIYMRFLQPLRSDPFGSHWTTQGGRQEAFTRWVELLPTTNVSAYETASCLFQHFGRFGTPSAVHTDR